MTQGEFDEAVEQCKESIAVNEALGRKEEVANEYANLGVLAMAHADAELALQHWEKAAELFEELGAHRDAEKVRDLIREISRALEDENRSEP